MATLQEIYALVQGAPLLRQRFLAARIEACWDVLNEDPGTTNHADRLAWAESILDDIDTRAAREYTRFLSNATIQTNGESSSDNDIQFVVNSMLNDWADDFAAS